MSLLPPAGLLGALCLATFCLPVLAAGGDEDASAWSVRAFGTGAVTWTDNGDAEFARLNQSAGAGTRPRAGVDSNLGVQLTYHGGPAWSATVQGLVRKGAEAHVRGELAWGYVRIKPGRNLSLRVGRMGVPVYMLSDYRHVGYANTAIRPPQEVYSLAVADVVDGADLTWKAGLRDYALSAQLFAGNNRTTLAAFGATAHVDLHGILGLVLQAERGPLSVRVGHTRTRATLDDLEAVNGLIAALQAAGAGYGLPALGALGEALQVKRTPTSFTSAGLHYDGERLVLQAELARVRSGGYASSNSAWYLLGGYRFGRLLPYASFGQLETDRVVANTVPAACPPGYPAECGATLAQLSAGVALATPVQEQKTVSLGLRWEVSEAAALKLQVDRVRPRHGAGLFINTRPGFAGPVTVGALALDFVY
jgi:hypothetical protein